MAGFTETSITMPAGRSAGDQLLYLGAMFDSGDGHPSGYSVLKSAGSGSNIVRLYGRTATADSGDNAAIGRNVNYNVFVSLRAGAGTFTYGTPAASNLADDLIVPSVTAPGPGIELIAAFGETMSTPSGFTEIATNTDSGHKASLYQRAVSAAGATGTTTIGSSVQAGVRMVLAA